MKFCILMWYDELVSSYGDINYEINKKYCDKNNIELIRSNERLHSTRHPAWERIPLILKYINEYGYDYVMWIDADAHFYIDSKNIMDTINDNSSYNFIFSKDTNKDCTINTGCFIVKNTQYSIDFLTKWGYDEILYNNNGWPALWDQGVVIDMFRENILDIANNCIKIDYGILQHFHEEEIFPNKPLILHLAGASAEIRINHSLNYIKKINNLND